METEILELETEINNLKFRRDDMLDYFEVMGGLSTHDIENYLRKLSVINHKIKTRQEQTQRLKQVRRYAN
jgi:preprotein translocase subunit Sec63